MARCVVVCFHISKFFYLSLTVTLCFAAVASVQTTPSDGIGTTAPGDQNITDNVTDGGTPTPSEWTTPIPSDPTAASSTPEQPVNTTEQPVSTTEQPFSTTEQPFSTTEEPVSTTEEPVLPAQRLPVSGRLPSPVPGVDRFCPCDAVRGVCDINCCCDRECSSEDWSLFSSCSVQTVSGSRQLCSRDVAHYSLKSTEEGHSELLSSVGKQSSSDILCIQSQNRFDGLSHPPPALPTDRNFEWLFQQFTSFMFGSESRDQQSNSDSQDSPGYQLGDVMQTAGLDGQRGTFRLPAPGLTAHCVDNSPAAFLKDQSSRCSRRLVLDQDCVSLPALSMDTYTNIQLLAGKNKDASVVPLEVTSVVLQSTQTTQTQLDVSEGQTLSPALTEPTLCANVVLKVLYVIRYSSAGGLLKASVSLVLGFVREASLPLQQDFQISYLQEDVGEAVVRYSGNPGYVVGMPLVSGTKTAEGISRSLNPGDTLSVLRSSEDQDCLQGVPSGAPRVAPRRSPLLFGVDSVSGCMLRLGEAANCSLVSQLLLDVLRGPNSPQYVASFGNSPLENPLDWIPIKSSFILEDSPSCSIPVSLHLEIQWTKYGSLVNPQAQIVSITEVIQTKSSSLVQVPGGGSMQPISSSVSFIPVSASARPGYRAMPTIDAKLPHDFFLPFV